MRKFKIITYYGKSDKKFRREFYEIEILDENDKIIAEYGDEYHDKGMDKKQAFLEGLRYCLGDIELIKENRNLDWE